MAAVTEARRTSSHATGNVAAVLDVLVHFTEFRNVDLYHQGVYYLRAQVYVPGHGAKPTPSRGSLDKKKNKKKREERKAAKAAGRKVPPEKIHSIPPRQIAVPHQFFSCASKLTSTARGVFVSGSDKLSKPARINDMEGTFCTRAILVRYVEEIQQLNDGCTFRLQVDFPPDISTFKPVLLVDLMWADVEEDNRGNVTNLKAEAAFRSVARAEFELRGTLRQDGRGGLHHYVPLLFDDTHFCQTGIIVHSVLHNLKFLPTVSKRLRSRKQKRLTSYNAAASTSDAQSSDGATAKGSSPAPDGAAKGRENSEPVDAADEAASSVRNELSVQLNTFAAYLFPLPPSADPVFDGREYYNTATPENSMRADAFYVRYVEPLETSYNDLAAFLRHCTNHCFPQELHDSLPFLSHIPNLEPMFGEGSKGLEAKLRTGDPEDGKKKGDTSLSTESDGQPESRAFSSRIDTLTPNAIATAIMQRINGVAGQIAVLWHQLMEVMPRAYTEVELMLRVDWEKQAKAYCEMSVISQRLSRKHLIDPPDLDAAETHGVAAEQLRKDPKFAPPPGSLAEMKMHERLPVFDVGMFSRREVGCIFFKSQFGKKTVAEYDKFLKEESGAVDAGDIQLDEESGKVVPSGYHVIVLQHGFQGSQFDMRLFRDFLTFLFPHYKYLIATSNQNDTDVNFEVMGERLAKEIAKYIEDKCGYGGRKMARLSFIGHSIGSVIVRTALQTKTMSPYLDKLHSFMTLSSPHAGHMFSPNYINTGLWLMKRWKKSLALEQVSLTDARDVPSSFMYGLSKSGGLSLFKKKVVLVSSHTDTYSPYHSARLEICRAAINDVSGNGQAYREMLEFVWKGVTASRVEKVDVSFKFEESGLDTLIGRAAHIRFLDSFELTASLCLIYRDLWD